MKRIENIKESVDSDDDTATDLQGNVLKSIDNCSGAALKASISKKIFISTFTIHIFWMESYIKNAKPNHFVSL